MSRLVATRLVAAATPVVAPVLRSAPRASPLARTVQAHASVQSRRFSSASTEETAGKVYQTLFKSNRMYITYIVGGSIVLSYVGNSVFDGLWAKMNEGVSRVGRWGTGRCARVHSVRVGLGRGIACASCV